MTSDDLSISFLHRFDQGIESYGVNTGDPQAFLGVTVLGGEILVADFIANEIQRFLPDGSYVGPFASASEPTFLESDSSGNVYTTPFSIGPPVATRYDSTGTPTQSFVGVSEFAGIDADAAGNVYIVDNAFMESSLRKYAPDGTFLNSTPFPGQAQDLSIDEASNLLYAADASGSADGIKIYDISGAAPGLVGMISTPTTTNLLGIHFAAESGNILVTQFDGIDPRGLEYSSGGVLLREYRTARPDFALDITTFIPEPGSLSLVVVAMIALGFNARRRS
jgi:hypothetical protein